MKAAIPARKSLGAFVSISDLVIGIDRRIAGIVSEFGWTSPRLDVDLLSCT